MLLRSIILTGFLIQAGLLFAAPGEGNEGSRNLSREDAAAVARQRYPGRVLSIRRTQEQPPKYRVKMLSEGDVRVITVPEDRPNARPRR